MTGEPSPTDPFGPPTTPITVACLHCGEEYDSSLIFWDPGNEERNGFWRCPTPGCDGIGFCFDIWPTDPEWTDEDGNKVWIEDDYDEESLEDEGAEGDALDESEAEHPMPIDSVQRPPDDEHPGKGGVVGPNTQKHLDRRNGAVHRPDKPMNDDDIPW